MESRDEEINEVTQEEAPDGAEVETVEVTASTEDSVTEDKPAEAAIVEPTEDKPTEAATVAPTEDKPAGSATSESRGRESYEGTRDRTYIPYRSYDKGDRGDRGDSYGGRDERPFRKRRNGGSRFRRMDNIDHNFLVIDYKRPDVLKHFLSERGKILPKRFTRISTKKQRQLSRAVKQARFLALLPYK